MKKRNFNYKFYYNNRKIYAVSTYAKKPVRGVAVCADDDKYDEAFGKELAAARCDAKIAYKRLCRAEDVLKKANDELRKAADKVSKAQAYYSDARMAHVDACRKAFDLVESKDC